MISAENCVCVCVYFIFTQLGNSVLFRSGQSSDLFVHNLEKGPSSQMVNKCSLRLLPGAGTQRLSINEGPAQGGSQFTLGDITLDRAHTQAFDRTPWGTQRRQGRKV